MFVYLAVSFIFIGPRGVFRFHLIAWFSMQAKVHSIYLGPKISGVELAFLLAWRRGYSLNYALWRTSLIKYKSRRTVSFDLCTSGVRQPSILSVHLRSHWRNSGVSSTRNAPWHAGLSLVLKCVGVNWLIAA